MPANRVISGLGLSSSALRSCAPFLLERLLAIMHSHTIAYDLSSLASLCYFRRRRPPFFPPSFSLSAGTGRQSARTVVIRPCLAELSEPSSPPTSVEEDEGPVEISSSSPSSLFALDDNPTPLQIATSVLLTGAITVFLFRSLRRRAKRAKELRFRSAEVAKPKDIKQEALDNLKAIGLGPVETRGPPSPVQALLGGITAGVIAIILYKFTTTIEAALNRQTISDNFSVRQLTITIRTIVNGLCYLATFVFGINSVGLILYSVQLAFSSVMEETGNSSLSITNEGELDVEDSSEQSTDETDSANTEAPENSEET
ncbi:hypothetical protein AXF42_Ash000217 [Apostasia shenzhenica]|uniref:DUF3082 domain-containing protein n=1 Tax=Apostasia shenzhenica TaxID=1088818 RepID=A0A2I0AFQ4_9ASPA|nr:hypothetical protein AXF42_Ash000217 [Apostasia shenzhenica]